LPVPSDRCLVGRLRHSFGDGAQAGIPYFLNILYWFEKKEHYEERGKTFDFK
jgi:hypothetical protein